MLSTMLGTMKTIQVSCFRFPFPVSLSSLGALLFAGFLLTSASVVSAATYPPTEGAMRGFVLLKERTEAPQALFTRGDGQEEVLANKKGKVLIVNFWATWCAPCVHEMPALDRLQAAFDKDEVEIVLINQDRGGERIAETFMRDRLNLQNLDVYLDPGFKLSRAFKNKGLPSTYAIDKQGRVVGGLFGIAEWDSDDAKAMIRHLLDE